MRIYDGADATSFPGAYENALFFADYSRDCIWAMRAGANGLPNPSTIQTFDAGASNPVWLEVGPDGGLYYADYCGGRSCAPEHRRGTVRRSAALAPTRPPGEPAWRSTSRYRLLGPR